ncbi:hypothetical protein PUF88_03980 [Lactobacillaceae bacterium L1_55_11]|nr:hypothetical protein [Lactobacillaceae bacterium L1_55_11]
MRIKFLFLSVVFTLLVGIGVVAIEDTAMPVPLPVDGAVTIAANDVPNDKTYEQLHKIAREDKIKIYKSYVNDSGGVSYYDLSDYPKGGFLAKVSANGIFYTSGKMSAHSVRLLGSLGIKIVADQSYPWFLGGLMQFQGQLRSTFTLMLFLLAFTGIFIFDVRSMKERMIRFAFGKHVISFKDIAGPVLLISIVSVLMVLSYAIFIGKGFQTFSTQLFSALVITDLLIFTLMMVVSLLVVSIMIKLESPLDIIKNKVKGKSVFLIWLTLIGVMIIAVVQLNDQVRVNNRQLESQINNLKPWSALKGWQKTQPFSAGDTSSDGQSKSDSASQGEIDLVKKIGIDNYIYLTSSTAYIPPYMIGDAQKEFSEQLAKDNITNPNLNKKVWYLSKGAISNQESNYPGQRYSYDDKKAATIYIPKSYETQRDSLINTVYSEQLKNYNFSKDDIETQVIPDNQITFLFNENATRFLGKENDLQRSYGSLINQVVVRLNDGVLLDHQATNFAANVLNTRGLLSPAAIKTISQVNSNLTSMTVEPYQSVELNVKSLKNQLIIANVLQVIMFSAVVVSIVMYVIVAYRFELATLVKRKILGQSNIQVYWQSIVPLLVLVAVAATDAAIMTGQIILPILVMVIGLTVAWITTLVFNFKIRKNYTTLLKGNEA